MGTTRHRMLPIRKAMRCSFIGQLKFEVTPGGAGNAADVGEGAIVGGVQNKTTLEQERKRTLETYADMQERNFTWVFTSIMLQGRALLRSILPEVHR